MPRQKSTKASTKNCKTPQRSCSTPRKTLQRVLRDKSIPVAVVDLKAAKSRFLQIYSDPQDLRDEQDIAEELGVLPSQLVEWRMQPAFYEPGTQAFDRVFRSSLVPLRKILLRQAFKGSHGAISKLLEMAGVLESKGTKINILNMGGTAPADAFLNKLTDEELDGEIALRLHATSQGDVILQDGVIIPSSEIMEADYVELDCLDYGVGRRRVDSKRPKRETSPVLD